MVLNVKSKINLKTSFSSNQTISQFYRYIALEQHEMKLLHQVRRIGKDPTTKEMKN